MRFILTRELGRLAKWLRILGYDTEYYKNPNVSSLIIRALQEGRIILTRNHRISLQSGPKVAVIEAEAIKTQVQEVLERFALFPDAESMFTRCTLCNRELSGIEKKDAEGRVPEYVYQTQNDFYTCPECRRIYWAGSHWGNVEATLKEITAFLSDAGRNNAKRQTQ
jgi:uncharacterized protein with PIN domain